MNTIEQGISIPVEADISGFSTALGDLQKQSSAFGSAFSSTIKSAVISGKSFEDTLKSMALRISQMALSAGLKPLETAASNAFSALFANIIPSAKGNVVNSAGIVPFAKGGVVSTPTFFGAGQSLGVMGEAGAEAIMPLSRGSDGRLGVRVQGGAQTPNIIFNVSTPDVAGFRRSQGQLSAMLARAVGRGQRNL